MERLEKTDLGQQEYELHQPRWEESEIPTDQAWTRAINEHVERELTDSGFTFTPKDKCDAAFYYLMDLVEVNALSPERAQNLYIRFQQIYGGF